jgi:hypothetical protein
MFSVLFRKLKTVPQEELETLKHKTLHNTVIFSNQVCLNRHTKGPTRSTSILIERARFLTSVPFTPSLLTRFDLVL